MIVKGHEISKETIESTEAYMASIGRFERWHVEDYMTAKGFLLKDAIVVVEYIIDRMKKDGRIEFIGAHWTVNEETP